MRSYTTCYRCRADLLGGPYNMPRLCRECDRRRIAAMSPEKRQERYDKSTAATKARKARDPEYRRRYNDTQNAKKYGMPVEAYAALRSLPCAICGVTRADSPNPRFLCVDHDHATGNIRDVLCMNCNMGLGKFKDDPELLRKALNYLRRHMVGAK